jgi:FkbM family methyltransferase
MNRFLKLTRDVWRLLKILGLFQTSKYIALRLWPKRFSGQIIRFKPKNSSADIFCRGNTSDALVLKQVFIDEQYLASCRNGDSDTIVDCGANVGYASVWYLSRYPKSILVAVEPEDGNFKLLQANLAFFGDRASVIKAAVWSNGTRLSLVKKESIGGVDWAWQVRDDPINGNIAAVSINDLLDSFGFSNLSILKMDIEGAEAVVFADPKSDEWLSKVDVIAIELHDNAGFGPASEIFFNAIANRGFSTFHAGELVIAHR